MTPPLRACRLLAALALGLGGVAPALLAPAASAEAPPHVLRRGDYLPPEVLRAGPNIDHAAAHLRRPPAGYGWFSLNGAFVLASLSTGLVVEVVRP